MKNPYKLSVTKVLNRVKELAAAKPNAVYQGENDDLHSLSGVSCYYAAGTAGGRVGCIFGQALVDLGVPRKVLKQMDEDVLSIDNVLRQLGVSVSPAQDDIVTRLQLRQDNRTPWGELDVEETSRRIRKAYRE